MTNGNYHRSQRQKTDKLPQKNSKKSIGTPNQMKNEI